MQRRTVIGLAAASAVSVVVPARAQDTSIGSDQLIEDNIAIINRWVEDVWQNSNMAALAEMCAPDYKSGMPGEGVGIEAAQSRISFERELIGYTVNDVDFIVTDAVADADKAMAQGYVKGTSSTSGKAVKALMFFALAIENGLVTRDWNLVDQSGLYPI